MKRRKKVDKFQVLRHREHHSILSDKNYRYQRKKRVPKVGAPVNDRVALDRAANAKQYFQQSEVKQEQEQKKIQSALERLNNNRLQILRKTKKKKFEPPKDIDQAFRSLTDTQRKDADELSQHQSQGADFNSGRAPGNLGGAQWGPDMQQAASQPATLSEEAKQRQMEVERAKEQLLREQNEGVEENSGPRENPEDVINDLNTEPRDFQGLKQV